MIRWVRSRLRCTCSGCRALYVGDFQDNSAGAGSAIRCGMYTSCCLQFPLRSLACLHASTTMSVIDVYLIIRYEGLKSTQYFSKFTAESVNELKKDLVEMGLPHPKRENIQLLSHGTLECRWQTTPNNHVGLVFVFSCFRARLTVCRSC